MANLGGLYDLVSNHLHHHSYFAEMTGRQMKGQTDGRTGGRADERLAPATERATDRARGDDV